MPIANHPRSERDEMNEPHRTNLGLVELVLRVEYNEAAEKFYIETVGLTRHSG